MSITLFWLFVGLIFYTYFGYTIFLILFRVFKLPAKKPEKNPVAEKDLPEVTLLIAAFNEKEIVDSKLQNIERIDYPSGKLKVLWITDGSDDGTPDELKKFVGIRVLHETKRNGKMAALNRAMEFVDTPFVVFSDANTMIAPDALKLLIGRFTDDTIGCVAGEKRIANEFRNITAGAGESIYWQYESLIKTLESDLNCTLSAAGELYAIRTHIFSKIEPDIINDDFANSLTIAKKGYKIKYIREAYAIESPSLNIKEELKRKIRIASGGIQIMVRMPELLNLFKYPLLGFQFISHKVMRWTIAPFSIPLVFFCNLLICIQSSWNNWVYCIAFVFQVVFYSIALLAALTIRRLKYGRIIFVPYYLIMMNYAQIAGLIRFISRRHSVIWEKSQRS